MRAELKDLIDICHKVYQMGYVAAYDGNLSCRTADGTILITRSAVNKGDVKEPDILEIDFQGNTLKGNGKISTENKIHLYAYKQRTDVNAVIHCHPVYTTAAAISLEKYPSQVMPEVILTLGNIPICEYSTPSTIEVVKSLEPHIKNGWAFILKNHGAVAMGTSLTDAYFKMEKLEHSSKILAASNLFGGPKPIPKEKIDELLEISEAVYGIKINKDLL